VEVIEDNEEEEEEKKWNQGRKENER